MTENDMEVDGGKGPSGQVTRPPRMDVDAIIRELKSQPIRNPCPRGKKIVHPLQARYLNCDISQEDSMNSTLSSTSVNSPAPNFGTPRRNTKRLTTAEQRALDLKRLRERQQQFHEEEMALGGYHDVFNDPCPEFKPRTFAYESTSEDDSQVVELDNAASDSQDNLLDNTLREDDGNVATSSQGRIGQGCSTPQSLANHTFAPLRKIDVSIVKCSESVSNNRLDAAVGEMATSTPVVDAVEQTGTVIRKAIASKPRTSSTAATAGQNDSMEDVLSKMQKTPKRVSSNVKRSIVSVKSKKSMATDVLQEEPNSARTSTASGTAANGTYSVEKANGTYVAQKDGTYVVEPAVPSDNTSQAQQNATFTVEQPAEIQTSARKSGPVSSSKAASSAEPMFAVPALPVRNTKTTAKTTVEQREKRINTSQKKNASILEMMDVDVSSPGRTLFAALPSKKQRTLVKTPVRMKAPANEDAMEISITMSDISQQPSVESGDDSVVDPVSDPRPSQSTPTRAPGFSRRVRNTPDVSLNSSSQMSPANPKSGQTPFAGLSPKSRRAALKESVERLSRPRISEGGTCHREWKRQEGKEVMRKLLHSPMVGFARDYGLPAPVTPFQPLDSTRMTIANADRSGTVRRGPTTRLRLDGTSLFPEESSGVKHTNLLKRFGDYKPQQKEPPRAPPDFIDANTNEEQRVMENAAVNASAGDHTPEPSTIPDAATQPQSAGDSVMSSISPRIPAGRNADSTTSLDAIPDEYEKTLMDAARQLSLEDISPARMDQEPVQSAASEAVTRRQEPQRLLADSLCSTNTPHRAPPEPCKRPLHASSGYQATDSFDDGFEAVSSEDSTVTADPDLIEVEGERNRQKLEPMVLKPRKIVHPEPPPDPNIRRSTRNRMKPVRQWLGEKPVYAVSPGGGRTLQGVTEVEIREQRWLKVRTADYDLASQRETQIAARKRALREKRRQEARERKQQRLRDLRKRHRRGIDLEITADSIVTSSDEEDSD